MTEQAILVTGGAGYIGSHTCKYLKDNGFLPVTIDNLSTGYAAAVQWGPLVKADIRDRRMVLDAIEHYDIKACIHFAAFSIVGESVKEPLKYFDNNFTAGTEFLATLQEGGVDQLVFSSTAAVYGLPTVTPIPEDHALAPINPYGASKAAFEQALYWLSRASSLRYVTLRYFNAAGASGEIGESHVPETHLLPLICQTALGQRPSLAIFGRDYDTPDGTCIRDFVHVDDLAAAHVAALRWLLNGGANRTYNVGAGVGTTVLEALGEAGRIYGRIIPHTFEDRRPGDPTSLVADVSAIKNELGWEPKLSDLDTLIGSTGTWQMNRLY